MAEDIKKSKEETNTNLKMMDRRLGDLKNHMDKKIEEMRDIIEKNKDDTKEIFSRMDQRMNQLEEAMKRSNTIRMKTKYLRNNLSQLDQQDKLDDQSTGRCGANDQLSKTQTSSPKDNELPVREPTKTSWAD